MLPSLPAGTDVTVWCTPPLPAGSGTGALLPAAEATRAGSYRRPADRDRFTTARALARAALGEVLGVVARAVDLRTGATDGPTPGMPFVPDGPSFSISHAGSWVLVAVVTGTARTGPRGDVPTRLRVGVDVESTDTARQHLGDLLDAVPPEERPPDGWTPEAFTRSWVRREAVLKAAGTGLLAPRDDLLLSPANARPAVVRAGGTLPDPARLALQDLDLPPVAVAGRSPGAPQEDGPAPPPGVDTRPPRYLAALALCSPGPSPAVLAAVTTEDGRALLARHGVPPPARASASAARTTSTTSEAHRS